MSTPSSLVWKLQLRQNDLDIFQSGANLKIILRRPRNGNALTTDMVAALTDCFRQTAKDTTISRIIITAEGKFFCTGMDLGKSSTAVNKDNDAALNEYRKFVELFQSIQDSPQVTIAAINGPCYAGGIGLAFSCDVRLAISSATVTLSEVKLGLCPAIISKYLVREWGPAFTREAMISGRSIAMSELKTIGAVHGLAENLPDLSKLLDLYVTNLRACAPKASSMCKDVVRVACAHGGEQEQDNRIKEVFQDMMRPDSESAVGVKNFQTGRKKIDWDSLSQGQALAKL